MRPGQLDVSAANVFFQVELLNAPGISPPEAACVAFDLSVFSSCRDSPRVACAGESCVGAAGRSLPPGEMSFSGEFIVVSWVDCMLLHCASVVSAAVFEVCKG